MVCSLHLPFSRRSISASCKSSPGVPRSEVSRKLSTTIRSDLCMADMPLHFSIHAWPVPCTPRLRRGTATRHKKSKSTMCEQLLPTLVRYGRREKSSIQESESPPQKDGSLIQHRRYTRTEQQRASS